MMPFNFINLRSWVSTSLTILLLLGCHSNENKPSFYASDLNVFQYSGRVLKQNDKTLLIGPASGVEFEAYGDSLQLYLKASNPHYDYLTVSINGDFVKKYKVYGDSVNKISLGLSGKGANRIGLHKATESANGALAFLGATAKTITSYNSENTFLIEFIGNSITCGMGADTSEVPCDTGKWFDQHNAYLAFGPKVARSLNADYLLSAVSGIGMHRNWNDENKLEPIMPDIYDNLYLNKDSIFDFSYTKAPDIMCIGLGTNDLSEGDGTKGRLPFNRNKFIRNYINFVDKLVEKTPDVKMVLLTSPMLSGEKGQILLDCLIQIKNHFSKDMNISIFEFETNKPTGCGSHPNIEEHKGMAIQLKPFLEKLIP